MSIFYLGIQWTVRLDPPVTNRVHKPKHATHICPCPNVEVSWENTCFSSQLRNAGVRIVFSLLHSDVADDQLCSIFRGSGNFRHAL